MTDEESSHGEGSARPSLVRPYISSQAQRPDWDDETRGSDSAMATQESSEGKHAQGAIESARLPPYLLTGGRARPIDESLEMEAQVMATGAGRGDLELLSFENRDIVAACEEPLAVAEVAAHLGLHLGVARVLVGDLVTTGHLSVRRAEVDPRRRTQIIERVIRGLQEIS